MIRFVEYLISKARGYDFKFDMGVPFSYVFFLSISQFFSLIRGVWKLNNFVYVGRFCTFKCTNKLILCKGVRIGQSVYIDALGENGVTLCDHSKIGSFSHLIVSGTITNLGKFIKLGENASIGEYSYVGGAGGVEIGSNTIIGQYFSAHPENHCYSGAFEYIRTQGVTRKGIQIGSNCWVGSKVTVLDGSKIGDGCVVAAGAVVSGEFPADVILAGVPARIVKSRI